MNKLALKVPPLALLAAFALLAYCIAQFTTPPLIPLWRTTGLLLMSVGAFLCVTGVIAFRQHQTTVDPRAPEKTSALVTGGIYALTRNPMYVGFAVILLGWCSYLCSSYSVLLVPLFMVYLHFLQILPEERIMQKQFADHYSDYCRNTPRWFFR